jgi:hypothetical protein
LIYQDPQGYLRSLKILSILSIFLGGNMPKDPVRNIDRYKIRGGHINEFEYSRHHTEISNEQGEHPEHDSKVPIPSQQTRAERIKQLLHKYGESVPGEEKKKKEEQEPASVVRQTEETPLKNAKPAQKALGKTRKSGAQPAKTAKSAKVASQKSPARGKASKAARGAGTGKLKTGSRGKKSGVR